MVRRKVRSTPAAAARRGLDLAGGGGGQKTEQYIVWQLFRRAADGRLFADVERDVKGRHLQGGQIRGMTCKTHQRDRWIAAREFGAQGAADTTTGTGNGDAFRYRIGVLGALRD